MLLKPMADDNISRPASWWLSLALRPYPNLRVMMPMSAFDFGTLGAYLIGIPTRIVALLNGVVGTLTKVQSVQMAGVVCLLVGGLFYLSLPAMQAEDRDAPVVNICVALALLVFAVSLLRRKGR
jgi:hypothetical protein